MKVAGQGFDRVRRHSCRLASGSHSYLSPLFTSDSTMLLGTLGVTPELKAQYLLTLPAIRDRCSQVHDLAMEGKLEYFEYHPENEEKVADFCLEIIQVDAFHTSKPGSADRVLTGNQTARLPNELFLDPSPRSLETH